jgi:RTC4-like domain
MSCSYGPMGESVILSTLNRLFPDTSSATNELASTLSSIYESDMTDIEHGDLAEQLWEGTRDSHSPMTLSDFLTYIVVPETAVLLIAKELNVTSARANCIRLESKDYGKAFYSETDDGRIDDITNANVRALVRRLVSQIFPLPLLT